MRRRRRWGVDVPQSTVSSFTAAPLNWPTEFSACLCLCQACIHGLNTAVMPLPSCRLAAKPCFSHETRGYDSVAAQNSCGNPAATRAMKKAVGEISARLTRNLYFLQSCLSAWLTSRAGLGRRGKSYHLILGISSPHHLSSTHDLVHIQSAESLVDRRVRRAMRMMRVSTHTKAHLWHLQRTNCDRNTHMEQ